MQDWIAFVGGGARGQLWFDMSYSVNAQIIEAASAVGTELAALADGILSPVDVDQPHATSATDGLLARAFRTENAQGGDLFVAVVNAHLAPVANVSLSVALADGSSALGAQCEITVPFEESRVVTNDATGLITEALGSYEARVYRVSGTSAATAVESENLVTNADFAAQTLVGTPDRWLLFPTQGTPAGGMDLDAVAVADPAAARRGSNTASALRVVLSQPIGTGLHIPLSVDHSGLKASSSYNVSFWARTSATVGTAVVELARSSRAWHYGDSSPALLRAVEAFVLTARWQQFSAVLRGVNGTLNLLPKQPGALWLSEPSVARV